jgi:hypothetical protein
MERDWRLLTRGPYNQRVKKEIKEWLSGLDFEIQDVLSADEWGLVRSYFQSEAGYTSLSGIAEARGMSVEGVRERIGLSIGILGNRMEYGEKSVVTLRVHPDLQMALLEEGVTRWDEVPGLEPEILKRITGGELRWKELTTAVEGKSDAVEWPEVRFGRLPEDGNEEFASNEPRGKWGERNWKKILQWENKSNG